ncbi:hypothetical protein RRG08_009653 [Elysia crispata]|uniref:Uncharacterized protein n=1 Tax=Elysia crispata TaxID=231223 RepID=A0AAE0ZV52_9GAST|nr:hypothetical protein RRG08_009653 [Elysia crispata]
MLGITRIQISTSRTKEARIFRTTTKTDNQHDQEEDHNTTLYHEAKFNHRFLMDMFVERLDFGNKSYKDHRGHLYDLGNGKENFISRNIKN